MKLDELIKDLRDIESILTRYAEEETDLAEKLKLYNAIDTIRRTISALELGDSSLARTIINEFASILVEYLGVELLDWAFRTL